MTRQHGIRTIEIERKYDVSEEAGSPAFVGVGPIAVVESPEVLDLDAVYFDTTDLALARAHVALRRRTGGGDAGWHIKRDADEGRVEEHWAIGEDDGSAGGAASVPDPLRDDVRDLIGDARLQPVARVRNHRVVSRLLDAAGYPVAEYCDDHVNAENLLEATQSSWREWEIELLAAAPDSRKARTELLDGLEAVVIEAGGAPSTSSSKLERALKS